MKKFIAVIMSIFIIGSCLVAPAYAVEQSQIEIPDGMALEDFLQLTYEEKINLVDNCYSWNNNMNARYKSGEDDPTHSDITTAGLTAFIEDKGFWATGLDGIMISLTIALYSLAPDKIEDESYTASNADHFYLVSTGRGLYGGTSASDKFVEYYNKAVTAQNNGNTGDAAAHLGRALHYIQDVSVPHHTKFALTIGHSAYEAFCDENIETYLGDFDSTPNSFYAYSQTCEASDLVPMVASVSNEYYDDVKNSLFQSAWDSTADTLTNYAAQMTSVVLYMFALDCGLTLIEV